MTNRNKLNKAIDGCLSLERLKKLRKKTLNTLHPDNGGNAKVFNAYKEIFDEKEVLIEQSGNKDIKILMDYSRVPDIGNSYTEDIGLIAQRITELKLKPLTVIPTIIGDTLIVNVTKYGRYKLDKFLPVSSGDIINQIAEYEKIKKDKTAFIKGMESLFNCIKDNTERFIVDTPTGKVEKFFPKVAVILGDKTEPEKELAEPSSDNVVRGSKYTNSLIEIRKRIKRLDLKYVDLKFSIDSENILVIQTAGFTDSSIKILTPMEITMGNCFENCKGLLNSEELSYEVLLGITSDFIAIQDIIFESTETTFVMEGGVEVRHIFPQVKLYLGKLMTSAFSEEKVVSGLDTKKIRKDIDWEVAIQNGDVLYKDVPEGKTNLKHINYLVVNGDYQGVKIIGKRLNKSSRYWAKLSNLSIKHLVNLNLNKSEWKMLTQHNPSLLYNKETPFDTKSILPDKDTLAYKEYNFLNKYFLVDGKKADTTTIFSDIVSYHTAGVNLSIKRHKVPLDLILEERRNIYTQLCK